MKRHLLILGLLTMTSGEALALNLQQYRPNAAALGLLTTRSADAAPREPTLSMTAAYARDPLVLQLRDGSSVAVVHDRVDLMLSYAQAVWGDLVLAALVPYVPFQRGSAIWQGSGFVSSSGTANGLADPEIEASLQLLYADKHFIDLALVPRITLPVGGSAPYTGDSTPSVSQEVAISRHFGSWLVALNVGLRDRRALERSDLHVGPELAWRGGVGMELKLGLWRGTQVAAEAFGGTEVSHPFANLRSTPVEALVSARQRLGDFVVSAGVGGGLVAGYGAPLWRTMLAVAWSPGLATRQDAIEVPLLETPAEPPPPAPVTPMPQPEPQPVDEDGDGMINDDQCPQAAEDKDGFADTDGCPDPDNDGDGITDDKDACPSAAEVVNEVADEDGCPDEGETLVELLDGEISMRQDVFFGIGMSVLKPRALRVLNQVGALLKNHREIEQISVEGHTDQTGDPAVNLKLSARRAHAVRDYMISRGVSPDRITVIGMGAATPKIDDTTPDALARNRRVAFKILSTTALE